MSRTVTVAQNAGFCFGVRRATDRLEAALSGAKPGERFCTLGHLIHNATYNQTLAGRGVETVTEADLPRLAKEASEARPTTVFIRAHGVAREVDALLQALAARNPYFRAENCTCPYVQKIHQIAAGLSPENHFLVVSGSAAHPEVIGFLSCFSGISFVFPTAGAFLTAIEGKNFQNVCEKTPVFVAQTTQNLAEWNETQQIAKKHFKNPIIYDTICSVTEIRQNEAAKLARECDFMIVIGGRESSNTAKLFSICKQVCDSTVWIETAADLQDIPFSHKVGIVAGASTPCSIIREVEETMSEMENFEQMLEDYSLKTLNTGDTVTGTVEQVNDAELCLDLGAGQTGYIKAEQITDDPAAKLTEMFKKGDKIEAFVIRVSDLDGVAELSKKRVDADKNWLKIVDAANTNEILEGKIIDAVKGGVIALVGSNRVFIPASQTGVPKEGDLNTLVGTEQKLRIIEVKDQGKKAIGSIRSVLREERKAAEAEFWNTLEIGKVFNGVVKSMTSYGAFVDLGAGVDGMVHNSELSWKHIKSPAEVVAVGQNITVFVKNFDPEKKRISLGYKTEESNPWFIFTNQYAVGDVASVKIVNMLPFGAFAEIVDGVDGLIHISQIAQHRIAQPSDVLQIGQVVDARIIDIDNDKHKVSLSIRALLDEAQAEAEQAPAEETETPAEDQQ